MATAAILILLACADASAQSSPAGAAAGPSQPASPAAPWSFQLAGASYLLPHDDDYVQPTVTADRGALHLESRYNYEDRHSLSAFLGWNTAVGRRVQLELTPMIGVVGGDTEGVIPALALSLAFRRVELYSENELVVDVNETDDSYFYSWSEFSVWPVEWLRAGVVGQRTKALQQSRDLQRGILAGVAFGAIETTAYFFNPGADDHYVVFSVGLSF
ncbi:MAG TPA: hypothetical protein VJP86_04665 [Vicinamibacterales bacterium]|nr:hypothetical protein [Vicinamibacterales bacterium]